MQSIFCADLSSFSLTALPWLADLAIKGLVITLIAGGITLAMRRHSAASRHLVWSLAAAGLLMLPLLCAVLPAWRVLPQWTAPVKAVAVPPSHTAIALPHVEPLPVTAIPDAGPVVTPPEPAVGIQETTRTSTSRASWSAAFRNPLTLLWPIWLIGALVCLAPTLLGQVGLWSLRRRASPISDSSWMEMARDLANRLRIRRSILLLQSGGASMPMTWGFVTPRILLPAQIDEWDTERRRVVLLHEMAHLKRWDCLTQLVVRVACAVHWFNPLAWVAVRRMVAERERACDDLVLAAGSKPSDYADQLLSIASEFQGGLVLASAAVTMARKSALEGRLLAVLDASRNRRTLTTGLVLAALLLSLAALIPLSVATARPGEETQPEANRGIDGHLDSELIISAQEIPSNSVHVALEFRLAEREAADGLTEATVEGSDQKVWLHERVELSNDHVLSARGAEGQSGNPVVELLFTEEGRARFEILTRDNSMKMVAILVDGTVLSSPVIREPIHGAKCQVAGRFDREEAERIAAGLARQPWPEPPKDTVRFGPDIELTVNDIRAQKACFVDLDEGILVDVPLDDAGGLEEMLGLWASRGIDATYDASVRNFTGIDMVALELPREAWAMSAKSVAELPITGATGTPCNMSAKGDLPATFVIWTREGGKGLLQLTGLVDEPKGVKIQYKLLQTKDGEKHKPPSERVRFVDVGINSTDITTFVSEEFGRMLAARIHNRSDHTARVRTEFFLVQGIGETKIGDGAIEINPRDSGVSSIPWRMPAGDYVVSVRVAPHDGYKDVDLKDNSANAIVIVPEETHPVQPKTLPAVSRGQDRLEDNIDLAFKDDPQVVGRWKSVDFVKTMDMFEPNQRSWRGDLFLKELEFLPNGKTGKSWWTWTKGVLMHSGNRTAAAYTITEQDNAMYMFLEWKSGDYTIRRQKPSFYVLKKVSSSTSPAPLDMAKVRREIEERYAAAHPEIREYIIWTAEAFGKRGMWLNEDALAGLSAAKREEKIEYLAALLSDSEYGRHLCRGLAEASALKDERLVPGLMKVAGYQRESGDYDCRPKWIAVSALARQESDQAVPLLISLVDHGNQNTRKWARAALVRKTGHDLREDKAAWGTWWESQGHDPLTKRERETPPQQEALQANLWVNSG